MRAVLQSLPALSSTRFSPVKHGRLMLHLRTSLLLR